MSNSFYEETLLKQEFKLVAKLQKDAEFSKYVTVFYEDRNTWQQRHVSLLPDGVRYPEKYIVHYKMPVYISPGQLRTDWEGTVTMTLSELVLTNRHAQQAPLVIFHSNFKPFNNHVTQTSICSGNAWVVAKDNGLWHFIISLGALINQDEFVSAEGRHYDAAAYDYWVSRDRKPVTNIKWALDLLNKPPEIVFIPKNKNASSPTAFEATNPPPAHSLNINAKTPEKQKQTITFTRKEISSLQEIKITEKKK